MDETLSVDTVIVGAGISGLIAAYELKKQGKRVALIEQASLVGGCIRSSIKDGFTLEHGANTLVLTPRIASLLAELHLDDRITQPAYQPYKQYVWSTTHHAPREVPRHPVTLLKTDLFSFAEKIKLLRGLFQKTHVTPDDSVAAIFSKLLGTAVVERALAPALRGIFGGDPTKLKLSAVFHRIATALNEGSSLFAYAKKLQSNRRKIFHLRGGNALFPERLAAQIGSDLFLHTTIEQVQKADNSFVISCVKHQESSSKRITITAHSLLLAQSGTALASFLEQHFQAAIPVQRFAPITAVHFAYNAPTPPLTQAFGMLFPQHSGFSIIGVLFNSGLFPHVAPAGQSLLTVCLGGIDGKDCVSLSDQELVASCVHDLERSLQLPAPALRCLGITRWPHAIPQYEDSFYALRERLDSLEQQHPGLLCVGVDRGNVGVPDRIERVLEQLDAHAMLKHKPAAERPRI